MKPLGEAPAVDPCVVTRAQHLGHRPPPEVRRARVLGLLEETICSKAFGKRALGVAHEARHQARYRLDHQTGRNLSPAEHHVADAQFAIHDMFANPVVNAFVTATEQAESGTTGQFTRKGLIEATPARAQQKDRARRVGGLDRGNDRFGAHQHPGTPTEGGVVDRAVHVRGVLPQVMASQVDQTGAPRLAEQGLRTERVHQPREDREHVDAHVSVLVDREETLGRVDRRDAVRTGDDEDGRYQRARLEFEDVVGGIRQNTDTTTTIGSATLDHTRADEFMNPHGLRVRYRLSLEFGVGQGLGRCTVVDALELHQPTGLLRLGGEDGEQTSASVKNTSGSETLRAVSNEVDVDLSTQSVGLTHPPDDEQVGQSTKSTSTSTPSRLAAARTRVRIACAVLPRFPMTRPRSSGPTRTSRRKRPRPGEPLTTTASGLSTMDRTTCSSTADATGAGIWFSTVTVLLGSTG